MAAATLAVFNLAGRLINAAALGALAVSLQQLGRVRGRAIDAAAIVAIGVTALGVIVSMSRCSPASRSEACFRTTSVV